MAQKAENRKSVTREKIVQTGAELFSKSGYHNTQVMDIVKMIGMSAGTFYNHFKDKRDLFEQIGLKNIEGLRLTLKKLRQPSTSDDILDRITRMHDTYNAFFDYIEENPQQFLMILRGGFGVDEDLDNTIWSIFVSVAHDLADDFQKWQDLGYIKEINTILLGHMILGMCLQTAHSYLFESKFTREEAINTLIALNKVMFFTYLTEKGRIILKQKKVDVL